MKKFLIIVFCLLFLVGCGKKENETDTKKEEVFVLEKIEKDKDYVYLTKYETIKYWNETKDINLLTINIKGENIDNINLELKNFVINSVSKYQVYNGKLIVGNIIDYDYFITDDYISVIQRYFMTSDEMVGDKKENVYVISLKTGKSIDNSLLLKDFNLSEEEVLSKIQSKIDTPDIDYWMSIIKKDGYRLYVNNDNKICAIVNIETDDELIKKELVLN